MASLSQGLCAETVRRFAVGAEVTARGVSFRVWAPACERVAVVSPSGAIEAMEAEGTGYFSLVSNRFAAGSFYAFGLDGLAPIRDPASRFQPDGPRGWSEVLDPDTFRWSDRGWTGIGPHGQVIYELHLGTFTPEGTFAAAAAELEHLADLGVTVVELMPVADFAGAYGWGYDGVALWAPTRLYGRPDDLRRLVDHAHRLGIGVILDVVYNHLGPDGCVLERFTSRYFTDRYANEWGKALNFDGAESGPVREFFVENAAYWVTEFHLDGLRFDATQQMFDSSPRHILADIGVRARAAAAPRTIYLVAENERQEARLARPTECGGYGLDALWNDDFHHAALVALTGRNEAYYSETLGSPQELISAVRWGYLYQGQRYLWQRARRGTPAFDLPATSFVTFLENHDQVANSGRGARLSSLTTPGRLRALTALLLLGPGTPMLFQGQEFGATAPFLFFADIPGQAGEIARGRREFLSQFPSLATGPMQAALAAPHAPDTFARCRIDVEERERHAALLSLHRALLRLRRSDPAFAQQRADRIHGAVLGPEAFVLRFFHEDGDRLLLINLGRDLLLAPAPEPLLAPPTPAGWHVLWGSEDVAYGGTGIPPVETDDGWRVQGHAAVVLAGDPG